MFEAVHKAENPSMRCGLNTALIKFRERNIGEENLCSLQEGQSEGERGRGGGGRRRATRKRTRKGKRGQGKNAGGKGEKRGGGGGWKRRARESARFMSDMVIFISPGKKAGFHAVAAFILVSNDKGSRGTETGAEGNPPPGGGGGG